MGHELRQQAEPDQQGVLLLLVSEEVLYCSQSLTMFRTGAGGGGATPTTTAPANTGGSGGGATPTGLTTTLPKSSGAGMRRVAVEKLKG